MVEMQEVSDILASATPASIVLFDEVGRGTSYREVSVLYCRPLFLFSVYPMLARRHYTALSCRFAPSCARQGLGIAWSVLEFFGWGGAARCRTLFATHMHELAAMAILREGKGDAAAHVQCCVMEAVLPPHAAAGAPVLTHRIRAHPLTEFMRSRAAAGSAPVGLDELFLNAQNSSHGLAVAARAGLPPSVLARAGQIVDAIGESAANLVLGQALAAVIGADTETGECGRFPPGCDG